MAKTTVDCAACERKVQMLDRMPPADLEAERALLGSLMLSSELIDEVQPVISTSDFYDDANAKLYSAIIDLHSAGKRIDPLLLRQKLEELSQYEHVGGSAYLASVFQSVPNAAHGLYYATGVRKQSVLRQLIRASTDTIRDAFDPASDPDAVLESAASSFCAVGDRLLKSEMVTAQQLMHSALADIDSRIDGTIRAGVKTGFSALDTMTGGFRPGQLVILAGRPGMGKTAMAMNMTINAARAGSQVVVFSLEMASGDLADRLLAIEGGVSLHKLRSGFLQPSDRGKLVAAAGIISKLPIMVLDDSMQSVRQITAHCRRIKRKHGLGLVVIDYLQLADPSDRRVPRQEQVAGITRALKALAKDCEVPVLCLAQLNRQVEQGTNNRPKLSQLRESGAVEQDADLVLFIHRAEYYLPPGDKRNDSKGQADVIVAKQRNGPTGEVQLVWLADRASFGERAAEHMQNYSRDLRDWNAPEPKNDWQQEAF